MSQSSGVAPEPQVMFGSLVSSHSRQIQSPARFSSALSEAGTIVTPQVGQIGGRSSSTSEVCVVSEASRTSVDWTGIREYHPSGCGRSKFGRECALGSIPASQTRPGPSLPRTLVVEDVGAAAGSSLGVCPGDRSLHVFGIEKVVVAGAGRADPEDDAEVDGGIGFPLGVHSRIDGFGAHPVSIVGLGGAALGQ